MPYSLLSDTELWNLFLKGDKKALAYIYKKQYRLLLAYGIKLCNDPGACQGLYPGSVCKATYE